MSYRPQTPEERKRILVLMILVFIVTIGACVILTGIGVLVAVRSGFDSDGISLFSLFTIAAILFSIGLVPTCVKARKDQLLGLMEIHKGVIGSKFKVPSRGGYFYIIKLNENSYTFGRKEWNLVNPGDELILEWMPNLRELLNIVMTGRGDRA